MINVVYYLASGQVRSVKRIQEGMEQENAQPDESWLVSAEPVKAADVYVNQGAIVSRPVLPVTHTTLVITTEQDVLFENVPEGAIFYHPDGQTTVTGGSISWGSDLPGGYILRIELFPYTEGYYHATVN